MQQLNSPISISHVILVARLSFLFFPVIAFSQSVSTPVRIVSKVNDGIYLIRHRDAPDGNPQGNTTVIIGEKKVIVVDACYLPSSAREDIGLIKSLTEKPVDYLINTHWHADHQQGDAEYVKAFPHVTIIAHEETAAEMVGFETKDLARYRENLDSLKNEIITGKRNKGEALTPAEMKDAKELYSGQDSVERELENYKPCYPDLTITGNLNLDIGNEVVRVLYAGPVHTKGDIMVLLPKEKLLIAGDIVVFPIPYFFGGGYPYSGLKVLEAIDQMDLNAIVPGHGELLTDKVYVRQVIELLKNTILLVEEEVHKEGLLGIRLENVQNAINLTAYKQKFAKNSKENADFFDESIGKGLVEGCFNGMAK